MSTLKGNDVASSLPKGVRVVNAKDPADIAAARADMYADTIRGFKSSLAELEEAVAKGDHKTVIGVLLSVCANTDGISHNLAELLTKGAMAEYMAAGGKLPTNTHEALELALRLFPRTTEPGSRGVGDVSPTELAIADQRKGGTLSN